MVRWLFVVMMAVALRCGAAEVEGVKLADKVRVGDAGPELVLNGAGVRTRVFFKVYVLDFLPGTGTRVVVNREAKGTIPGDEFSRALLRIWLGESPADASLKKAMLGG